MCKKLLIFCLVMLTTGCASNGGGFTETMNSITDSIMGFANRAGSKSSWINHSKIKGRGKYKLGKVEFSISEPQILTKAQIDPVKRNLVDSVSFAETDGDHAKKKRLLAVFREIDRKLWTTNDVIIFKITNMSDTYSLPGKSVNYLLIDKKTGKKIKNFTATTNTIEYMNKKMYMVDLPSGKKAIYTNGKWDEIPPLESAYIAIIQTRLKPGEYEAVFNNVPVEFNDRVVKKSKFKFSVVKS